MFTLVLSIFPLLGASLVIVPAVGGSPLLHVPLPDGMPSLTIPGVPYAEATNINSLVVRLGPTRILACKETVTDQCWTLNLGDTAWERADDMLYVHQYSVRSHVDLGHAILVLGGKYCRAR